MSVLQEISPHVRNMKPLDYSLLARRTKQINEELRRGVKKPYQNIIEVSASDPHSGGLRPLTFVRQVIAACLYPQLINSDRLPVDVRQRAQRLLGACAGGSVGSYTATAGISEIVQSVSDFITRRDGGIPSNPENIYISPGSHWALQNIFAILVNSESSPKCGVLTPVPGYSNAVTSLTGVGAVSVPYYLAKEQSWELQVEALHRALESAKGKCKPVALYVINPGNPTGQVQSRKSIQEVIRFVSEKRLFLLVDEVYQDCVFGEKSEFVSYKKVLFEMGQPYSDTVEMASIHSVSKGFFGECGLRGGYVELVNLDSIVLKYVYNLFSKDSCAPVLSQVALDLMTKPPQAEDASYPLYCLEIQKTKAALCHNLKRFVEVLNSLPGFHCAPFEGGTFAFPRLHLPPKAIHKAKEVGLQPDTFYCMRLLEEAGVFTSPGCDFQLNDGSYYIRVSIMISEEVMEELLRRMACFHKQFMKDFS